MEIEDKLQIKKYEELYKLSKDGLDEELKRFHQLDEKASRFLSVLSILLVVSGFAGKFAVESVVPPVNLLDWLCLVSALVFIISILIALLIVFSVLMIQNLIKIPMSKTLINFFDTYIYLDAIYALTKGNIDAVTENRNITDRKVKKLTWAYWIIFISIIFAIIFVFAIVVQKWNSPTKTKCGIERSSNYAREG